MSSKINKKYKKEDRDAKAVSNKDQDIVSNRTKWKTGKQQ